MQNFQQVQPGEDVCKHTVISDVANAYFIALLQRWAVASWDVSTAFLYAQLREEHTVYSRLPNVLVRLGLVRNRCGLEVKQSSLLPEDIITKEPGMWGPQEKRLLRVSRGAFGNGHMSMILLQMVSQSNLME